jgi:hypothetical protein
MLYKLDQLEKTGRSAHAVQSRFIQENKPLLEKAAALSAEEMRRVNTGEALDAVLLEREILRKFGGGPDR